MLTQLRIENFKGWRDTGLIKMAPITLFFGSIARASPALANS